MASITGDDADHAPEEHYHVGDVLGGKYRLLGKAGEGATGTVWVAMNLTLESKVAIKLIHPEMRLPVIAERVMREARAAARLNHSAIVRVFDLGETERGDPYIVMELLVGEALRTLLDRERCLPPERALSLVLPLIGAMHAAHERGIIHRDLKPDNIMLARIDGGRIQPKIVDFGIAKLSFGDGDGGNTGALVIGTPGYMSPEQAGSGDAVDRRTDVWSVCAMLYEMLCGETPFPCTNALEAICAVIRDPVPPLTRYEGMDETLWAILSRGLQKDPKERWTSMRTLGEALSEWLAARGVLEDVSGLPLRALWLGSSPAPSAPRARRSFPASAVPTPVSPRRTRSEDLGVASSVHFANIVGNGDNGSFSRRLLMGGLTVMAGVMAWKIAFSPVGPAGASAPIASATAALIAAPVPAAAPLETPPPPPAATDATPSAGAAPPPAPARTAAPMKAPVNRWNQSMFRGPMKAAPTAIVKAPSNSPAPSVEEPEVLNNAPDADGGTARPGARGAAVDAGVTAAPTTVTANSADSTSVP